MAQNSYIIELSAPLIVEACTQPAIRRMWDRHWNLFIWGGCHLV